MRPLGQIREKSSPLSPSQEWGFLGEFLWPGFINVMADCQECSKHLLSSHCTAHLSSCWMSVEAIIRKFSPLQWKLKRFIRYLLNWDDISKFSRKRTQGANPHTSKFNSKHPYIMWSFCSTIHSPRSELDICVLITQLSRDKFIECSEIMSKLKLSKSNSLSVQATTV